jgi:hypothetical protein
VPWVRAEARDYGLGWLALAFFAAAHLTG